MPAQTGSDSEPDHGVAHVGRLNAPARPFALGGTQFALRYGQGFHGWIGDTRITAKPLRPDQFPTAAR